jgi:hypothetical protein
MKTFLAVLLFGLPLWPLSGDLPPSQVVGHWRYIDAKTGTHDVTFEPGGTFSEYWWQNGKIHFQATGEWSIHGSKIVYKHLRSSQGRWRPNYRDEDQVLAVSRTVLVTRAIDRRERRWSRVQTR